MRILLLGLSVAAMTPAAANAQSAADVAQAMHFVHVTTGLPLPAKPPKIVPTSIDNLQKLYPWMVNGTVLALYQAGTVHTLDVWDGRRDDDRSFLYHEVTHYMLDAAGRSPRCAGDEEAIAYRVQGAYLATRGKTLADIGVTPAHVARQSSCDRRKPA